RLWESLALVQEAQIVADAAALDAVTVDPPDQDAASQPVPVSQETLRETLAACRAATVSLEEAGALDRAAFGLFVEGVIQVRLGELEAAERCFEQAREAAARLNAHHLLFQAHEALGDLHEGSDPEAAIESYR